MDAQDVSFNDVADLIPETEQEDPRLRRLVFKNLVFQKMTSMQFSKLFFSLIRYQVKLTSLRFFVF